MNAQAMTQQCEIAWFSALCDDDYEFLGVPDPQLQSSWEHCRNIVLQAEKGGFDNVLLPSGYQLGLDTTVFAAAMAPLICRIKLLWATRIGEDCPPQLARRITTLSGKAPAFYFGGLSHEARECAAEGCDVYLMWPDTMDKVRETVADMTARAARYGRTLKFGYRAHVIVRETEEEARAYADRLLSKLDDEAGRAIREKSLDARNFGVQRQAELRGAAGGDGFVEENLWTGIGRARSGCGAAIVGDPDQVLAKLRAYQAEGIEAFILSGYPHAAEADLFSRHVLPNIQHGPLEF